MTISLVPKSVGSPAFPIGTLFDGTNYFEAAAVYDPVSGKWANVGADGRVATSSSQAVLTPVSGAQYALSVGASPTNVTLTVPPTATHAWITVDPASAGNYLRYTYDGTNPSTTVGHALAALDGDWFMNLAALEFTGDGGAMIIHVSYFKS